MMLLGEEYVFGHLNQIIMLSLEGTICFGTLAEGRRDDGFCNGVLLTVGSVRWQEKDERD